MDTSILLILLQDGVTNGAVYALLGLAIVLVFAVTRVIFIPQGEFVSLGALTLAAVQSGTFPATAWLVVVLGAAVFLCEAVVWWQDTEMRVQGVGWLARRLAITVLAPGVLWALARWGTGAQLPLVAQMALSLALVVPLGPWLYRLAFAPLAHASVLTLLVAAVAAHFSLMALGLVMFGAEGARTVGFSTATFNLGEATVSWQAVVVVVFSAALMAVLFSFFARHIRGKALMATAVNPVGAQLVGVSPTRSGQLAFGLAAAVGAISGMLISPMTTVYYDSGFLMGLKGFVAAVLAGLASYPIAAVGAVGVGVVEAFSSFYSSAYKEAIVFTLILPALLWRSVATHQRGTE